MRIDRVEVRVVGPQVQRFTWSHDLPEQYMTNTVVRIFTDDGVEGVGGVSNYTSYRHDRYTAETLRHLIPALIGRDPLEREALWRSLWSRVFPLAPGALAVLDIALWDLLGKAANLPIYQLLGGARRQIPSYASTPMLEERCRLPGLRGPAAGAGVWSRQVPLLVRARQGPGAGPGRSRETCS